jgi:hypothetical protein
METRKKYWVHRFSLCMIAVLIALAVSTGPTAVAQSPTTHNISLALADQSIDAQGRTVITMMATGDLQGVFTLVLSIAPDGTVTDGEWALNVSYMAPLNPNAQPDPSLPDPDSPIGEQLIQRGVIKGLVNGGSAVMSGGVVDALVGVALAVTGGTLEFASVPNGNGIVSSSNTTDRNNSTGSIVLNF